MAYGCMDTLKGRWGLSREPFFGGKVDLQLTSDASGNVGCSATLTINGQVIEMMVSGRYNGGGIGIEVLAVEGDPQFSYEGSCEGPNLFKGPMYTGTNVISDVTLRYLS